jgi:hypothetical protein
VIAVVASLPWKLVARNQFNRQIFTGSAIFLLSIDEQGEVCRIGGEIDLSGYGSVMPILELVQ